MTTSPSPLATPAFPHPTESALIRLERHVPEWLKTAVIYQIYPQSFADTNGDGIGDLPGVIAKLDYIRSLGCDTLWLNPVFDSPFGDAGYDIRNYKLIAPRYGTNADAQRLFAEAHRRGMHVCFDLVAGHTSIEHPWFVASSRATPNPYSDFYAWVPPSIAGSLPHAGSRPESYLRNFFAFQPALYYGHAKPHPDRPWERSTCDPRSLAVRLALEDAMRFWLELGCDGFRVDMAASLVKGAGDDDGAALAALWTDFRSWLARDYPEAALLSEWSNARASLPAGFDVDFAIHSRDNYLSHLRELKLGDMAASDPRTVFPQDPHPFFSRDGQGDITKFLDRYLKQYLATRTLGFISLPTGNHDFSRPRSGDRDREDMKVFFTMLLTLPGVPTIYYGDEIGQRDLPGWPDKEGAMWRGSCRSPMQWDASAGAGFSSAPIENYYLPPDPDPERPNVATEEADPDSLLHHVRRLLALRRANPSLGNLGAFAPVYAEPKKYPFVYRRSGGDPAFLIAVNPSDQETTWPTGPAAPLLVCSARASLARNELRLGPVSYTILAARP